MSILIKLVATLDSERLYITIFTIHAQTQNQMIYISFEVCKK